MKKPTIILKMFALRKSYLMSLANYLKEMMLCQEFSTAFSVNDCQSPVHFQQCVSESSVARQPEV